MTSPARSDTSWSTAKESKRRRCKSGQVICKGPSNKRSGDASPGRGREWNKKVPTPKIDDGGRRYGDRGVPSHRRSCAKEMSSASSSLHWSPQWSELFARIRFGRCPNVNSQGTSWRATVTTHFGLHDDVKMLCGIIMRDSETFKEMECAKTTNSGTELRQHRHLQ